MTQNVWPKFRVGERVRLECSLLPHTRGTIEKVLEFDRFHNTLGRPYKVRCEDGTVKGALYRIYARDILPVPAVEQQEAKP